MVDAFWLLPIFSGFADAAARGVIKKSNLHSYALNAGGYLFTLPWYIAWLFLSVMPSIQHAFWITIILVIPLSVIGVILTVKAHQRSPLTLTAPFLSITPAVQYILAPIAIILGIYFLPSLTWRWPSIWGALGIPMLVAGIWVLGLQEKHHGFLGPFLLLKSDSGARLIFIVGLLWGVTAYLDFIGFQQANKPFYLLMNHGLISVSCIALTWREIKKGIVISEDLFTAASFKTYVLYGSTVAVSMILQLLAYEKIPLVPYVISGKRVGLIISAMVIGILLAKFAKDRGDEHAAERQNLKYRFSGAALMIAGMLIVVFLG